MKTKDLCQCGSTDNRSDEYWGELSAPVEGLLMERVNGFYLYKIGFNVHPLVNMKQDQPNKDWFLPVYFAREAVKNYLTQKLFKAHLCQQSGMDLYRALDLLWEKFTPDGAISSDDANNISTAVTTFENVVAAELGTMDLYAVLGKEGYDTRVLIENGHKLFPDVLEKKVPEAVADIKDATRCIAFWLPTAAGFHLHRANESVLHHYWYAVAKTKDKLTLGTEKRYANMGDYLTEMKRRCIGDEKVITALQSLKDLHRNPLMHPEQSLDTVDDAIALLGAIQSVVVPMLAVIPDDSPAEFADSGLALTPDDRVVAVKP